MRNNLPTKKKAAKKAPARKKAAVKKAAPRKPKAAPNKGGRPPVYSEALADLICERLASGLSLRKICEDDPTLPTRVTITKWLANNAGFLAKYARAREVQAHVWVDEMYETASSEPERQANGSLDSASVAHIRNRVTTMQWLAMKLNPKKYGDKLQVGGDEGGAPIRTEGKITYSAEEAYLLALGGKPGK